MWAAVFGTVVGSQERLWMSKQTQLRTKGRLMGEAGGSRNQWERWDLHRDHRREGEHQIYRIQRSPGKPAGSDARLLVLLGTNNPENKQWSLSHMFNSSKVIKVERTQTPKTQILKVRKDVFRCLNCCVFIHKSKCEGHNPLASFIFYTIYLFLIKKKWPGFLKKPLDFKKT